MSWRLARSLDVLAAEIEAVAPGTTVWTIGNEEHQATWSDHNPNAAGVVCAADILDDAGLDLQWLADTIVATDPPALKYVIWRDRIWLPGYGWQPHRGQYHGHVHVSVGWGPDGRSTGPYDDTSPWGLATTTVGGIMLPKKGDSGQIVKYWQRLLLDAGEKLPQYGADGDYGDETVAAVRRLRLAAGAKNPGGDEITGWTARVIQRAAVRAWAPRGPAGPPGEPGPAGPPGKTPTRVAISGDVIATK